MSIFDEFDEIEKLFKKFREMGGGVGSSGYSISITYDSSGKPVINVKTYGNVDKRKLKEELSSKYPNAIIKGLDEEPLIKEVKPGEEEEGGKEGKEGRKLIWEDE